MQYSTTFGEISDNINPSDDAPANSACTGLSDHVRAKERRMVMTICQMHTCTYRVPPPTLELTLLSLLRRWLHV
jgi:hypothetical protein